MKKNILIAGASGMIGGHLLEICLRSQQVGNITVLVRKPLKLVSDKIKQLVTDDFTDYNSFEENLADIDIVFFCIGVYTGSVNRDLFRSITIDYPVALAKAVYRSSPSVKFILLSGAGADRTEKSKMMFAMDKGIAENRLHEIFGKNFHSARPGYIYPVKKRKEPNVSYVLMRWLYPLIMLLGKNFSITSWQLAQAIFQLGMTEKKQTTFENNELLELIKNR